jgi:hypothetical protein
VKFLCMGYHDERMWQALPAEERERLIAESLEFDRQLEAEGRVQGSQMLATSSSARTLRFSAERMAVTDGPFAETKEQLGGFMILEADDMQHAVQLMSRLPCMQAGGCVEIRPLSDLEAEPRAVERGAHELVGG